MPAPFAAPQAPRRSLGTSGVFAVADLSPAINPTNVDGTAMAWTDVLKPGPRDKISGSVAAALEAIREQALAAQRVTRGIDADPSIGEAERHRKSAKVSGELFAAAQIHVEKAQAVAGKSIEELTKILAGPDIALSDTKQVEIWTQLGGMPKDRRMAAISRSIARGSDDIVAALLGAGTDRFLSEGILSDLELEAIRQEWILARHPDAAALLAKRRSDLRYLESATTIAKSWQRATHNPAIAATTVIGTTGGAPGPVPINRASGSGFGGIARRAEAFR